MITIEEKLIFRNVKKAAIIWILALRMDPQPISESSAAEILQIDKETARKYLRILNECNIITRLGRFSGYALTQSGKQLALPLELSRMRASAEIPRSDQFNNIESLKDSNLNTSILLINGERGNPALERGNSAFDPAPVENSPNPVEKSSNPVEKPGISTDELIDQILEENPEKKEILDALLHCRISMNWKTIALLYSEDLTIQEIKSQYDFLDGKGMSDQTGILINNLLAKYKPRGESYDPDTGHKLECVCFKCIGARNARFMETFQDPDSYSSWNE